MKKLLLFLSAIALLSSCSPKIMGFKGGYPPTPIVFHSQKAKDLVWDNLIDFFAQKGISIKIIDKSSGLIISEKTGLSWSYENDKGKLKDPLAIVAIPTIMLPGADKPLLPYSVTGEWNVRLKTEESGTSININLVNFDAKYIDKEAIQYASVKQKYPMDQINGRTTGTFEKSIADAIR